MVAAWEPELAAFRERLADRPPLRPAVALEVIGVGLVEASIMMTRCVMEHRPRAALFLGTCGAFRREGLASPVGSVVTAARVELVDASVLVGKAALPGPMPAVAVFDARLRSVLVQAGARSVQVANTVAITTDDALALTLGGNGAHDVEHLEVFAFARACAAGGVPCASALAVANTVGASGRREWLSSHVEASAALGNLVFDALPALAAALLEPS